jgi:hypothetical protein
MDRHLALVLAALASSSAAALAADEAPTDVQQPGTQPGEVTTLQSPDKCDNCHGGYASAVEPAHNWRGSMMAHSARDPLYWAAVAVAEQDFPGAGDFCLRCHTPDGWLSGRSTPTDGSGLSQADADGVSCDLCHTLVNPDDSEHLGEQSEPFVAQDPSTGEAYRASGMYVVWGGSEKLGPYSDAWARHQFEQSLFHRSVEFCATCHDISNPAVGDLSPTFGAQEGNELDEGSYSGVPSTEVADKAAFNNQPFAYGVVERTFTEHLASAWPSLAVSDYTSLPAELQDGSIEAAYTAATAASADGNYEDGSPRTFTCQTCHMAPVSGKGANKKGAPVRADLPLHDLTGGNYWTPEAILWQDSQSKLLFQGTLDASHHSALADGQQRVYDNLDGAASLKVSGDTVRVVNLTGHKLISGYPEGRRMWLRVTWYDAGDSVLRTDGEYDRETGATEHTLGDLAKASSDTVYETMHFVLNDVVVSDTRIPPYGMDYDTAMTRNALPVPEDQYGDPGSGGTYDYWDEVQLSPPSGAIWARIELLYQPTSWEYIQFLKLANDGSVAFLADEGDYLFEAWQNTDMAAPYTMASTTWGSPTCEGSESVCDDGLDGDCDGLTDCADPDCSTDDACVVCDGDGVCEDGEDCQSCAEDCEGHLIGNKKQRFCCGNGQLEVPEIGSGVCDGNP